VWRAWVAIESNHQVMQDVAADPENGWDVARNVRKLAIEDEPETWKGEKLDFNLVPPSVERNNSLCRDGT